MTVEVERHSYDVVVIGCRRRGPTSGDRSTRERGLRVAVVTKSLFG